MFGDNENKKNLILAIVISVSILLGWQIFYEVPREEQRRALEEARQEQILAEQKASEAAGGNAGVGSAPELGAAIPDGLQSVEAFPKGRADSLEAAPRVTINAPLLSGSISLRGARFDDLTLLDYRETIEEDSPNIILLHPSGTENPYYAEFGWIGKDGNAPTNATVWAADRTELSPGNPVTLSWTNDAGMIFEQVISLDNDYLFEVTQRVRNESGGDAALSPYGLISRTGTPDILGFYILHEGLIGVFDETLKEVDYDDLLEDGVEQQSTTGGWLGITDKYWLAALVPDQTKSVRTSFKASAPGGVEKYQADFITDAVIVAAGETYEMKSRLFAGAKITTLLDQYQQDYGIVNFDLAVDFGWFYWLTKPIFYMIHWLNGVLGNFGLAILALTVGIKLLFFPLANKSYRSMSKMKLLQPKLVEMKERYGDDRQQMSAAMMELYKKEQVNPLSGCLPILVQIPVFFSLYKVLFVTIEMRHAPFFGWIHDLSAPDPLGLLTLFGTVPWEVPAILAIVNIGIWPIIMGLTMYAQQKLNPAPTDPVQARVFMMLPFFFTFLLGTFPAGLVIYWAWNNFLSIVQQYVIMRRMGVAIGGGKAEPSS